MSGCKGEGVLKIGGGGQKPTKGHVNPTIRVTFQPNSMISHD